MQKMYRGAVFDFGCFGTDLRHLQQWPRSSINNNLYCLFFGLSAIAKSARQHNLCNQAPNLNYWIVNGEERCERSTYKTFNQSKWSLAGEFYRLRRTIILGISSSRNQPGASFKWLQWDSRLNTNLSSLVGTRCHLLSELFVARLQRLNGSGDEKPTHWWTCSCFANASPKDSVLEETYRKIVFRLLADIEFVVKLLCVFGQGPTLTTTMSSPNYRARCSIFIESKDTKWFILKQYTKRTTVQKEELIVL